MQGFVDRIARTRDGAIEIQDYKTSARVPSQADVDEDRQLALYQIGIGARFGAKRPVRLVWRYLRQRRTLVSTRTPEQLDELAAQTRALIDRDPQRDDLRGAALGAVPLVRVPRGLSGESRAARGPTRVRAATRKLAQRAAGERRQRMRVPRLRHSSALMF